MNEANEKKYATLNNLQTFLNNLKNVFAEIPHTHTKNEITDFPDINSEINKHNVSTNTHNDMRIDIEDIATRLSALADCDDETLDQISEIVQYIKDNRELIELITTSKVSVSDIIDNLETNISNKPLSAAQGVHIKTLLDTKQNITNVVTNADTDTELVLCDNTEYYLTNVSTLSLDYPDGNFEVWMKIQFAFTGTISVLFPSETKYIGVVPTFNNGETYEISIKDGVAICWRVE